jgi:hypothetical protein
MNANYTPNLIAKQPVDNGSNGSCMLSSCGSLLQIGGIVIRLGQRVNFWAGLTYSRMPHSGCQEKATNVKATHVVVRTRCPRSAEAAMAKSMRNSDRLSRSRREAFGRPRPGCKNLVVQRHGKQIRHLLQSREDNSTTTGGTPHCGVVTLSQSSTLR